MEQVSSVKDYVTSGLPDKRLMGEVGGLDGKLVVQNVGRTNVYMTVQDPEKKKVALAPSKNEEKGKLEWMLSWRHCCSPRNIRPLWKILYHWGVNLWKFQEPPEGFHTRDCFHLSIHTLPNCCSSQLLDDAWLT